MIKSKDKIEKKEELEKIEELVGAKVDKKRLKKISKPIKFFLGFFLVLILVGGGLAIFLVPPALKLKKNLPVLGKELNEVSASFQSQDFKKATDELEGVKETLAAIEADYQKLSLLKFFPFLGRFYQDGLYFLKGGFHLVEAAEVTGQAIVPYYDILGFEEETAEEKDEKIMTVEERLILVLDTLDKIQPQFDQISDKLIQAQKEIGQIDPARYPDQMFGLKVRERIVTAVGLVDAGVRVATEIRPIMSYFQPLLGIPEKKTYFLLFQNDAELRPSGGFMTAYAFLSVHNGKFTPLSSHDIYSLDAKFGNRLPAPEPILNYLPDASSWHLRDMNLSPDFGQSMKTFWENYQKIPGAQKIDGIIALDTKVLVDILHILGPIGVSGWGNFSAENDPRCDCPQVFYELELYADKPTSDWREDRKGIIGPLMHSILGNIMGSPRSKWPLFVDTFLASIREKHLLFYFFDEEIQGAIETLNAAGEIREFEGDYFHLNDCNFGGAKSNMYIRQKVTQEIEIDSDGFPVKTVTVEYKNPAPASNCNLEKGELCLNGFYRDWFRLYVPQGSTLIESTGSEVGVKTYEELGKTVFEGFYGKTPSTSLRPEGKLVLTFKYKLPFKAETDKEYPLLIQKQPGTPAFDYEIKIGKETKNLKLDTDKELQLRF